jgi:hypothetical protein
MKSTRTIRSGQSYERYWHQYFTAASRRLQIRSPIGLDNRKRAAANTGVSGSRPITYGPLHIRALPADLPNQSLLAQMTYGTAGAVMDSLEGHIV